MSAGPDGAGWIAAHVFYDDDLDPLITGVLPGLRAELAERGLARDLFFLRYWDGGRHLRLRVRPESDPDAVRAAMTTWCEDYLAREPAPDVIGNEQYLTIATQLSTWEQASGFLPRQPNNTVRFLPYRREHHRYGYGAAMAATEKHFVESSAVALDLLTTGLTDQQRLTSGYTAVTIAWLSCPDESAPHDGTVDDTETGPVVSPDEADRVYAHRRDELSALTGNLRNLVTRAIEAADPPSGAFGDLATSFALLRTSLEREVAAGTFRPPGQYWDGADARPPVGSTGVLPVLDICAHLFCNRIGLSPQQEKFLRALAARAAGEARL